MSLATRKTHEETVFQQFADDFGPEKVVYIYEPRCNLRGIVVIDNTSVGLPSVEFE